MNLRQSPGAQRARQTCYFNPTSSLVSHAQSKSMLLCFLCIYVCVCTCVCACVCICEAVQATFTMPFTALCSRLVARGICEYLS